jgi:hypothetical protein
MIKTLIPAVLISVIWYSGFASAQNCTVTVTVGGATTGPCVENRIDIPVYMDNPCTVGGFTIQVGMTDPSWFEFDPDDSLAVDTIGAWFTSWGNFEFFVHPYGHNVTVTAIGPGGQNLPPGNGLIFTIHGDFDNKLVSDTCQLINFGTVDISDSTGYDNYPRSLVRDYLCVGICDSSLIRGDANGSGSLNGLDVTFLVGYLKGGPTVCLGCVCQADANTSGDVNGLDVIFLTNYFKGGPAPDPPACP